VQRGIIRLSPQALIQALGLPADASVAGIRLDAFRSDVEIAVDHQGLKPVADGEPLPLVTPRTRGGETPTFICWEQ
jgi:hypothetical protein